MLPVRIINNFRDLVMTKSTTGSYKYCSIICSILDSNLKDSLSKGDVEYVTSISLAGRYRFLNHISTGFEKAVAVYSFLDVDTGWPHPQVSYTGCFFLSTRNIIADRISMKINTKIRIVGVDKEIVLDGMANVAKLRKVNESRFPVNEAVILSSKGNT
jgi:hypothetical protein